MTPDEVVDVCRRYEAGETIEAIIESTPHSYRRVREALVSSGVALRPPKAPVPPCPPGMAQSYRDGATIRQLATRYGHSYNRTRNMLIAAGVTLRRRGNPQ
ncbi:helix-turn-helix domain-containing protein [Amycolatopsis sp. NPDC051102]|uniref:helix-turn-helix domain-containing protein n=1 Tax=Amycolatopsis sp. NPDC051102 TaxID=3155163 RepID=UPI003438D6F6